jgi:hypothetical protein
MSQYGTGRSVKDFVLAPWLLLFRGGAFENAQFFSPLPMIVAPVILWRARLVGSLRIVLGVATAFFLIWLASMHVGRYLMTIQPLAACLAADALAMMWSWGGARRVLCVAVAGIFLIMGGVSVLAYDSQFAAVVLGREGREAYLARTARDYPVQRDATASLPRDARVLFLGSNTYFLQQQSEWARASDFASGPEHLWQILEEGRFTHVLMSGSPGDETTAKNEATLHALAPRVRQMWSRTYSSSASRTFGGIVQQTGALYAVSPGGG